MKEDLFMACEGLHAELDHINSQVTQLRKEYDALIKTGKNNPTLRNQVIALGKQMAAKEQDLRTCLTRAGLIAKTARTGFRPETDGFLFNNNWFWDQTEKDTLKKVITDALGIVEGVLSPILWATLEPAFLAIPPPFDLIALAVAVKKANDAIANSVAQSIVNEDGGKYGLCGGMAFASLDYFFKHWVVPQGTGQGDQPQRSSPHGATLRNYIWTRLLRSVVDNAGRFLQAMGMVSRGADGAKWLVSQTATELSILHMNIDVGRPVPIGLIGTTNNPFHNHQVVCYGYELNPDKTHTLFIYDNNRPGLESVIRLDTSGPKLKVLHDDTLPQTPDRGPLQAFFVESYTPSEPPKTVVLSQGVTAAQSASAGKPVDVQYTVSNVGFHPSTKLTLAISSDKDKAVGQGTAVSIPEGGQQKLDTHLTFTTAGDHKVMAWADLGTFGPPDHRVDILKILPPESGAQQETVTVKVA
jgi:hypothetical protein